MERLQIAIVDDKLTGIVAIRFRDFDGQYPLLGLSHRSKSQANKRAKAILEGTLSPVGFLIRKCARRTAHLIQERRAPLSNHPMPGSTRTFSDYIDDIIAAQNRQIEWLSKQTYTVADKRRRTR
jgi:hypothetical protein